MTPEPEPRLTSLAKIEIQLTFESMDMAQEWIRSCREEGLLPDEGDINPVLPTVMRLYARQSG